MQLLHNGQLFYTTYEGGIVTFTMVVVGNVTIEQTDGAKRDQFLEYNNLEICYLNFANLNLCCSVNSFKMKRCLGLV